MHGRGWPGRRRLLKRKKSNELHPGCLSLFGLPFLLAGLFLTWLYFSGFVQWWKSQSWVEVPCWIESAELKVSRGDDSDTYRAEASYWYRYGGRMLKGDRVSFDSGGDNIGDFQRETHRELSRHLVSQKGKAEIDQLTESNAFRCYVNPGNPSEAVLYRTLRWELQAFKAIFALTFPAVGAGLVVGGMMATGLVRRREKLRLLHPQEPWKWRREWSGPRIAEYTGPWATALYGYTLWSAVVVFTLLGAMMASGAFVTEKSSWLVMILVLLWCIPAFFSLKRIRSRVAAGQLAFEPQDIPIRPGSRLAGCIVMTKPPPLRSVAEITVECERQVTDHSGSDSSTSREKVWSKTQSVPSDIITRDLAGFRIPVEVQLPGDAPESTVEGASSDGHSWKLHLKIPQTPVASTFEVPVFHLGGERFRESAMADAVAPAVSIDDDISAELPARLAAQRVIAEFSGDGSPVSIICPPARHRSLLVFLIAFDLIWTAAAVFLIVQDAPLIFQIVWPLSATGIWVAIVWNLLHKRSVTFDPAGVYIRNQLGPASWGKRLEKSRIVRFVQDVNMTSNNTRYNRIRAEDVHGRNTTLVDGISEATVSAELVKRLNLWRNDR